MAEFAPSWTVVGRNETAEIDAWKRGIRCGRVISPAPTSGYRTSMRLPTTAENSGRRIAIIDDDPIVIAAEQDLLEAEGHEVHSAETIVDGVELVRQVQPDLLLLDYMMPGGTGADVVRAIRQFDRLTQVVLVSSVKGERPVRQLLSELDIQGYHCKADGNFRLLLQVDAVLRHSQVLRRMARQQASLRHILRVTPEVTRLQPTPELLQTALDHLHRLLESSHSTSLQTPKQVHGLALFGGGQTPHVAATRGHFETCRHWRDVPEHVRALASKAQGRGVARLGDLVGLSLSTRDGASGCLLLEVPVVDDQALVPARLYISQLEQALENSALFARATTDALTCVFNRDYGQQLLRRELEAATITNTPTSLILLDVDHFKALNDTYGHAAGDEALRLIAQCLRRGCRQTDIVARYGGEEFFIVLPGASPTEAAVMGERILQKIRELRMNLGVGPVRVTASAGIAVAPPGSVACDDLLERADVALYQSKSAGRDRVTVPRVTSFSPGTPATSQMTPAQRRTGS